MTMNRKTLLKVSPYICGFMAGLTFSQPIIAVSASVLPVEDVVKTKYPKEIKEIFKEMQLILDELESVEDVYEEGKTKEYLEKIEELLPLFFKISTLDIEREFLSQRKEGDILDVIFARTVNILYEIPMKQGHKLIKEFAKNLRDSYFDERYIAYHDMLKILIINNPDKQLDSLFSEYLTQLDVFGTLGPDQTYDPDSIPELNPPKEEIPDFNLQEELDKNAEETWDEYYSDNGIDANKSENVGSAKPNYNNVYNVPAPSNRVTYNVSYDVVGNKCVKTKEKLVNGKSEGMESEIIPDNVAYRYCPTDEFFFLYEGFNQDDGLMESTETVGTLVYEYNGESAKEVKFTLKDEKISYKELTGILDVIVRDKEGYTALDASKKLYALDGKPLIISSYEGEKTIEEVNQMMERYTSLKLSIVTKEEN